MCNLHMSLRITSLCVPPGPNSFAICSLIRTTSLFTRLWYDGGTESTANYV